MRLLCELLSQLSRGRIDSVKIDANGITAEGPAEFVFVHGRDFSSALATSWSAGHRQNSVSRQSA